MDLVPVFETEQWCLRGRGDDEEEEMRWESFVCALSRDIQVLVPT